MSVDDDISCQVLYRYSGTHDIGNRSPSEALVCGVAKREGVGPRELPVHYESINPEALDALFNGRPGNRVTFAYAGYEVTVDGNRVGIEERSGGSMDRSNPKGRTE